MKKTIFMEILAETGEISNFTAIFFRQIFSRPFEFSEFFNQCYTIGNKTVFLVGITAFIMGLVLTAQSYPSLKALGAESWLPKVVSISLIREIVPVITAVICAGKIGSGMGAELGSMKVSEQIDAMEVSGINPMKYLVVTRVLAATFMVPILVVICSVISLLGAYIGIKLKQVISLHLFSLQIIQSLGYEDIIPSIAKAFFFGFAIGIIGCYKGYSTTKGTQGVGKSANSAVIISTLAVFLIDLIAVQMADIFSFT